LQLHPVLDQNFVEFSLAGFVIHHHA